MATLTVDLGTRSYPIHIGTGLLGDSQLFSAILRQATPWVITDDRVAPLYLRGFNQSLGIPVSHHLVLQHGEQHKDWHSLDTIFTFLLKNGCDRDTTLIALGGGVIGDLTGFAAACYQRGIDYIQVPTTLLAQVDSSVGGKTAINHAYGKNMIGAFHHPLAVIADINTLGTLPQRELRAGLAEIIKCSLISDEDFFFWLETHLEQLLVADPEICQHAVTRACGIKAVIVAEDERERGRRVLLNLGHTFGHAIETALGYGEWLHGEAVSAGIAMAAELAVRMDWLSISEYHRIDRLLERTGLPRRPPASLSPSQLLESMRNDKKTRHGRLRLVLPKAIGKAMDTGDFDPKLLHDTLAGKPI